MFLEKVFYEKHLWRSVVSKKTTGLTRVDSTECVFIGSFTKYLEKHLTFFKFCKIFKECQTIFGHYNLKGNQKHVAAKEKLDNGN